MIINILQQILLVEEGIADTEVRDILINVEINCRKLHGNFVITLNLTNV